jgi:hypothetical protein
LERTAQLWSRNQKNFARRFPGVVKAIAELPGDTVIDGEVVVLDEGGRPSFDLLQGLGAGAATVMYAFDLLMLRGKDVRVWPLDDRREQLAEITRSLPDTIRYSETWRNATPEERFQAAQHASVVRWQKFREWKAGHPEEAAAAAAVAKALRALCPRPEVTDDVIVARLEKMCAPIR